MWLWSRARRRQIEESEQAVETSRRLGRAISHLTAEGREVAAWARDTLEENHLAELFVRGGTGGSGR